MHHITPHLWFDKQAKEATEFYAAAFPDAKVTHVSTIHNTPSGDADIVSFEIAGQPFMAISAGPYFKINPSISFFVNFDPSRDPQAREHLDELWKKLSDGGKALMPLDKYPFSEHYGWIQDKYGVSWQLILSRPEGEPRPFIVPSLMFVGNVAGKAEEAMDFYVSVFSARGGSASGGKNSKKGNVAKRPEDMGAGKKGTVMYGDFMIANTWLAAMDSAAPHKFTFNEAISLVVPCDNQKEIDYYWEKLSADPKAEQCGWCKDQFGVSWQVWPEAMGKMMMQGTPEQVARVTQAFLKMKKFNIAELERAFAG